MVVMSSSLSLKHLNNHRGELCEPVRRELKNLYKRIKLLTITLASILLLASCDSKISKINIHGTYKGVGIMNYEAVVEEGTITIYSTSFFEKNVYWYGTCIANEMNEDNIIVSRRLATNDDYDFFGFGFGSMNKSRAAEKEILFTSDSLTFIYDMGGMAVQRVTLQKEGASKKKYNEFDSNAEKADPNYKDPTIPLPPPPGQTERPTEPPTTEAPKNDVTLPEGDNFSL